VGLAHQGAAVRVEADGQEVQHHLVTQSLQLGAVVDGGQRMEVDDGVDRLVAVLERDVVLLLAEVVAEMRGAGRLDATEHALAARGRIGRARGRGLAHRTASVTHPNWRSRGAAGYG